MQVKILSLKIINVDVGTDYIIYKGLYMYYVYTIVEFLLIHHVGKLSVEDILLLFLKCNYCT